MWSAEICSENRGIKRVQDEAERAIERLKRRRLTERVVSRPSPTTSLQACGFPPKSGMWAVGLVASSISAFAVVFIAVLLGLPLAVLFCMAYFSLRLSVFVADSGSAVAHAISQGLY